MEGSSTSSSKFNFVCVFGWASIGKDVCYHKVAYNLGKLIAKKQIHLVYHGGGLGLVGLCASSAYIGGTNVLGVIPQPLGENKMILIKSIGDELRVSNIKDQMINMLNNVDDFVAFPKGYDTLEELFHVISWSQLNIYQKPIGLLNIHGFFDGLLAFVDHTTEKDFISTIARQLIIVAETPEEIFSKLYAHVHQTNPFLSTIVWTGVDNHRKRKLDLSLTLWHIYQ